MSPSRFKMAAVKAGFPVPPGTSPSWMPASSLYCCQRSVSISSAAARNRRIATSPFVSPPFGRRFASASAGSSNRPPAPRLAAPTAAPFSRKERRLVASGDCSLASIVYSFRIGSASDVLRSGGLVWVYGRDCRRALHPRKRLTSLAAYGKPGIAASGYFQALLAQRGAESGHEGRRDRDTAGTGPGPPAPGG